MTTTTARARPRGPVLRAAARMARLHLRLFAWFWVVVVTAVVLGVVVLWRVDGEVGTAVSLYARQGVVWFPFSLAVLVVAAQLRVHVAAGRTRRTFVRASLAVAVGTGVAYAVVLQLLVLAERAVHDAAGWGWRIADPMLADESSPAGVLLAELVVFLVAAQVSGLLVGVVYQRAPGWWGTLALPLTVGPLLGVAALLGGAGGDAHVARTWPAAAPPLLGGVALVAVMAVAYAAVTRTVEIRQRTA
ncbi:hypothetical protein LFM56_02410 [Cellulomonas iranensis]|uniref:hypothetical protein n=1 Tax=Cellulomonas iranensis TaxID=76862 RepID=UPI001CF23254|nr:hypothetical protein [Cellulomonas iranensis]UCN15203.1 hypothetical protein LFM56_02410 [Cellulomonas iranensis]